MTFNAGLEAEARPRVTMRLQIGFKSGEIFLLCLYIFLVNNPFYAAQCNPNVVVCVYVAACRLSLLSVSLPLSPLSALAPCTLR